MKPNKHDFEFSVYDPSSKCTYCHTPLSWVIDLSEECPARNEVAIQGLLKFDPPRKPIIIEMPKYWNSSLDF